MTTKTKATKVMVTQRMIPIRLLHSSRRLHLPASPRLLQKLREIAAKFNWQAFGTLIVGQRSDGSYWIVDGMQRYRICVMLHVPIVPCTVFPSAGYQHEAQVFTLSQG
jgi:hypothetical protein